MTHAPNNPFEWMTPDERESMRRIAADVATIAPSDTDEAAELIAKSITESIKNFAPFVDALVKAMNEFNRTMDGAK